MGKQLLMGNEAMALGAIRAGVQVVTGYPGTPSSEVLENIAKHNKNKDIYVEWSVNEKVAMEIAAGASYAGCRCLVTMKQVGMNVAADPLMNLAYIGIKGGIVVLVADDPGPISSQTEQDTRQFGVFSKIPIFDPSTPTEAYDMIVDAFEYSEKYQTPVIFRPTTRVCHGCDAIELKEDRYENTVEGFVKDSKWVIFPRLSYQAHLRIEDRNPEIAKDFSSYSKNTVQGDGKLGIMTHGNNYGYVMEILERFDLVDQVTILKVATPYPFPEDLALRFLQQVDRVLAVEELSAYLERELIFLCGKHGIQKEILGKLSHHIQAAGENSVEVLTKPILDFLGVKSPESKKMRDVTIPLRPPVLCAGCPHRSSFYTIKKAMKGKKCVFTGDIGCYTLGNAKPLEMVDTCLCMGAGITIAQGIRRAEPDTTSFAFIGDSTFFHSGITGIVNAVYNQTDMILVVLDNGTTAMTGKQPHPGTGMTMMENMSGQIRIPDLLRAIGIRDLIELDPFDLETCKSEIVRLSEGRGVRAIVFESPCIKLFKPDTLYYVDEATCVGCKRCVNELGCPAIIKAENGKVRIDESLCYGCSICAQVCPFHAIKEVE